MSKREEWNSQLLDRLEYLNKERDRLIDKIGELEATLRQIRADREQMLDHKAYLIQINAELKARLEPPNG